MTQKVVQIHLEQVDSTNTWARNNYQNFDLSKITRITADEQSHGRGQFKRTWLSPKGNIYLTYFFTIKKLTVDPNNLPQIFCVSLAKLMERENLKPQIKWPNDVLIHEKKIAGILCETLDFNTEVGVVLGIGINVNMPKELLDTIDQDATSFLYEKGAPYSIESLLQTLDSLFLEDLERYLQEGFTPFYKIYDSLLLYKKRPITIKRHENSIQGILHSLHPDGRLNILLPSGEIQTVNSGEVIH